MLCVRKMLFWWPLNITIPSDDAEWLSFVPRLSLKNPNALRYVIRPMMQCYIFCKMLERRKAVKLWMSIVTFLPCYFYLVCSIFLLKRLCTEDHQYSKLLREGGMWGRGWVAMHQYRSVLKQKSFSVMMTIRINCKLDCPTYQRLWHLPTHRSGPYTPNRWP